MTGDAAAYGAPNVQFAHWRGDKQPVEEGCVAFPDVLRDCFAATIMHQALALLAFAGIFLTSWF